MRTSIMHMIEREGPNTLTVADNGTTDHFHFQKSGILKQLTWTSSDYASQGTFVITILDLSGGTIYTSAALAHDSGATITGLAVLLADELHSCVVTVGDPGVGGATFTVALLIER